MRMGREESNMKIDGRCHCGYISYEAEIDPEKVVICHCTDCRTLSGSALRTVALTQESACVSFCGVCSGARPTLTAFRAAGPISNLPILPSSIGMKALLRL